MQELRDVVREGIRIVWQFGVINKYRNDFAGLPLETNTDFFAHPVVLFI